MDSGTGYVRGMTSTAIEYATFHRAQVTITAPGVASHTVHPHQVSKFKETSGNEFEDILVLHELPYRFARRSSIHLHFEINHSPYKAIVGALDDVDRDDLLKKLLPSSHRKWKRKQQQFRKIKKGILDDEYQADALTKSLKCDPAYPFLILGPFGTGKTRLLVGAAVNLTKQHTNYVLVCTHMNRGADYFCEHYCNEFNNQSPPLRPTRVVSSAKAAENVIAPRLTKIVLPDNITTKDRLVVTTFITASLLKDIQKRSWNGFPRFTHILIDEGAQSTEPEVLCALTLGNNSTKIIIAGDNYQVPLSLTII